MGVKLSLTARLGGPSRPNSTIRDDRISPNHGTPHMAPPKTFAFARTPGHRTIVVFSATIVICAAFVLSAQAAKPNSKKQRPSPPMRLPQSVRNEPAPRVEVAPLSSDNRAEVRQAASSFDIAVLTELAARGDLPGPTCDDATFLRRIYLDVAGRIPTFNEASDFLNSADTDKREDLIDRLLQSPDYVSHTYNRWADVLRLHDRPQPNIIADPYHGYIKASIAQNKPYDTWVGEMLTADGKVWQNPATGFQLRDDGMPLPYIDNTVRVFLGTQIGCAQCHDHPFDEWSQKQFYELAAMTSGTRTRAKFERNKRGRPKNPANELIKQGKRTFDKGKVPGQFQRLVRANTYEVWETKGRLKLPHDYAYSDAEPESIVEPAVLWGEVPTSVSGGSGREQFAAWLTSPQNERFSQTIVNRLWSWCFGVGMVNPIDDFSDEHPCVNPMLMDALTAELRRSKFDVRHVMRCILYSDSYQREAVAFDVNSGDDFYFAGPIVRRMTAEQVWDSILTLTVQNPWPFERPTAADMAEVLEVDLEKTDFEEMIDRAEKFGDTWFRGTYQRSLRKHAYAGQILCRASELPSPLPLDHFLRQFGQSDREVIDGGSADATVPQILTMLNGPITHAMLEPGSVLVDRVLQIDSPRERVEAIFISILSRPPTASDSRVAASELTQYRNDAAAYGNVAWALLNTREFMFIR